MKQIIDGVEILPIGTVDNIDIIATGAVYFGDRTTDGSWRFIRSGNDLDAERRESGVWVAKGGFTA